MVVWGREGQMSFGMELKGRARKKIGSMLSLYNKDLLRKIKQFV